MSVLPQTRKRNFTRIYRRILRKRTRTGQRKTAGSTRIGGVFANNERVWVVVQFETVPLPGSGRLDVPDPLFFVPEGLSDGSQAIYCLGCV